jgi:hypothetical protein
MKKISYLITSILTLASCQKEEIINNPVIKHPNYITTWGYYIPTNAERDTTIWIDSFQIQTWDELYHDGVKWHEELIKVENRGIDTLSIIKTEAYTGSDNHREDIFIIKSKIQELDLTIYQNKECNENQKIDYFNDSTQTLVLKHLQYSSSTSKRVEYHYYFKP